MPDISKILQRKKPKSTPQLLPAWTYKLHLEMDEQLAEMFTRIGSERLKKITKQVAKIEQRREEEKKRLEAQFRPIMEERAKLENSINDTIAKIRKLPEEALASEGVSQAKNLHSLLAEMEKNDSELQALGSNMSYSYRSNDLPIHDTNGTLHFIAKIRNNIIFRIPKKEK